MAKQEEIMKDAIVKKQRDFDYLRLFKVIQFYKPNEVSFQDIKRLFTLNNMTIADERIE